ncbi:MAG: UDP-N-acetylmuramoyl-L-alanine--D-glutamate ligase [Candidatus Hydrogenedentota bacterium]
MDLQGKAVAIAGLGQTALALAKLLKAKGAAPFVSEVRSLDQVAEGASALTDAGISFETGGHSEAIFTQADLVVPSPGVSPRIPPIAAAVAAGIPVWSELEAAFHYCQAPIVAVTGTNGKTTVTELLRVLLAGAGYEVILAGNNSRPFSDAVLQTPAPDYVVLEVSSYQLEGIVRFRPWMGAVLNVSPDHLARHGTIEAYAAAKARLFENQRPGDVAVLNAADPWAAAMARQCPGAVWWFSTEGPVEQGLWLDGETFRCGDTAVGEARDTQLPGRHNLANVLAALTLIHAGGFAWNTALETLRTFPGVEHRIEHVATVNGVDFYNDSKSTNIESLRVALACFCRPVVLIAGGEGKGEPYEAMRDYVRGHVRYLITLGEEASRLEEAWGKELLYERAVDMEDAARLAAARARPGDVVVLSPACASFDMFRNFEERGQAFKQCVRQLQEGARV